MSTNKVLLEQRCAPLCMYLQWLFHCGHRVTVEETTGPQKFKQLLPRLLQNTFRE